MKLLIEFIIAFALTLGAIIASASGAHASDISVLQAFARASATPTATSAAAYISVQNLSPIADHLTGIAAEGATMVMLHETRDADGVSMMTDIASAEIAANGAFIMI
jgi:periplasmic copper chaperone A